MKKDLKVLEENTGENIMTLERAKGFFVKPQKHSERMTLHQTPQKASSEDPETIKSEGGACRWRKHL
jgi:hypothetical protein